MIDPHVAADPDLSSGFEREAKTVAGLSHPHICPVFDVGSQDGIDYLLGHSGTSVHFRCQTPQPTPCQSTVLQPDQLVEQLGSHGLHKVLTRVCR